MVEHRQPAPVRVTELRMSSCQPTTVTCPQCGNAGEFTTWQSLNVDLNPEEKEKLLSGELTKFTCPSCGHSAEVAYPLLYHDMRRQLMIYLVYGGDTKDIEGLPMGKLMHGYRFRRVGSRNELLEKVRIFEADFDDRLMELFKLMLRRQMEAPDEEPLFFSGREVREDGKDLLFFVRFPAGGQDSFGVETRSFTEFAAELDGLVDAVPDDGGEWPEVSGAYARDVFQRYSSGDIS